MLILRTKTLLVHGQSVKLYSVDGKTWFSTAKTYTEFKRRRTREKINCQKQLRNLLGREL
jgi:hypothetical protein